MNNLIHSILSTLGALWACIINVVLQMALASPSLWVLTSIIPKPCTTFTALPYSSCRRSQSRCGATGGQRTNLRAASARGPPVVTQNHGEIHTPEKIWIQAARSPG